MHQLYREANTLNMALHSPQTSTYALDFLYCHEETWVDLRLEKLQQEEEKTELPVTFSSSSSSFDDDDDESDDQLLVDLISEEEEQSSIDLMVDGGRREAVEWMAMVNAHYGFSTLTVVMAVNYFDRFIQATSQSHLFHTKNMPWLAQLVSTACLSLASKVQETHVPLLLDFQINCKYVFEARTIRRMELLVLSTLEWKMNPVTPFSFFDHLTRKLKWETHLQWQILHKIEPLILSLIADPRYLQYPPSVVATATVLQAMRELDHPSLTDSEILLMDALRIKKDKVAECCKLIAELSSNNQPHKKRRICLGPKEEETNDTLSLEDILLKGHGIAT